MWYIVTHNFPNGRTSNPQKVWSSVRPKNVLAGPFASESDAFAECCRMNGRDPNTGLAE